MSFLKKYLDEILNQGNQSLALAIQKTVDDIIPKYIVSFSFREHIVGLLFGNIQSGKTSHMFGIMSAAADEGFGIFIVLTTDNILLQQQTLSRAKSDLVDFCICGENDYLKFVNNNMKKPVVIILKKNISVLKQWKNNFSSTAFCLGNPFFIVDDEADAASLNTLVNSKKSSAINKYLNDIKQTTNSSIYLQITGTPQSIILQTQQSGWKPQFYYYFEPGKEYLGGDFFFGEKKRPNVVLTDENEATDIAFDDEFPENGLKNAVISHLIVSAHILSKGGTVCNFLIHPSVKTQQHEKFAEKVGEYLNEINLTLEEPTTIEIIKNIYIELSKQKKLLPFTEVLAYIEKAFRKDELKILVMNSNSPFVQTEEYKAGSNIIIGGNSLGRGLTIPMLQTIYYCRVSKSPQADTMWQHARMFGYDRDRDLIRIYMPPILYKMFCDINKVNNSIIHQIGKRDQSIQIYYPKEIKPTRNSVINKKALSIICGGINYFPFEPDNKDISALDDLLSPFEDGEYMVTLNFLIRIFGEIISNAEDFNVEMFVSCIKAIISDNPLEQGSLIVRRNRDIAKGTGTLLSPNDRKISSSKDQQVVLTLYKITGKKGWNNREIWVPNIKLPVDMLYYSLTE